jgi:hypothetical protein
MKIGIETLSPGAYTLSVITGNKVKTVKLLVR